MAGPNRSAAVMQRRVEPHDSLDYFPTPPWATRALCERLAVSDPVHLQEVWEPACGEGDMARPLGEYFDRVYASDVHDYSATYPDQCAVRDFLIDWAVPVRFERHPPEWVITNPPFRLAEEFIATALRRATVGVAMFVRTAFLESEGRHRRLFAEARPSLILQFAERVPLFKGQLDPDGSAATAYCWIIWHKEGAACTAFDWVAPCRDRLERREDYAARCAAPAPAPLLDVLGGEGAE